MFSTEVLEKLNAPLSQKPLEDYSCKPFTREELIRIREKSIALSYVLDTSPTWIRVYQALADAADRLDAMIARTIVAVEKPKSRKKK